MRILVITPWYPTVIQPIAGIFVQRDAQLISTRHEVEVVHLVEPALMSAGDKSIDDETGFPIHRVPMSRTDPSSPLRVWRQLKPLIEKSDLIHSHAFQALLPFALRRVGRPWVHSEHWSGVANPHQFNARGRLFFRVASRLFQRPDMVTAVSSFLLDRVRSHRTGPTMIVPSVVSEVSPSPVDHSSNTLRLVTVANLVEGKDPMLAIDTLDELHKRGVAATLRWVGDGPLRQSVEDRTSGSSAITLLGALDRVGVSRELDSAEIFLLPTRSETLCLSAIEAISHGRPVVIGGYGGQRDYVNAENGILVDERNPQAYADAIQEVAASFSRLTPPAVAETVRGRFTPERVLALYEEAYDAATRHKHERERL